MECIIGYGLYHAGLVGCGFYLRMMDPYLWDYIVWNGALIFT